MASSEANAGHSVTPTQNRGFAPRHISRKSDDLGNSLQNQSIQDGRARSGSGVQKGSLATTINLVAPGSFSTNLKSTVFARSIAPRPDLSTLSMSRTTTNVDDEVAMSEQRQAIVRDKIAKEMKIKLGTENMLEALLSKNPRQTRDQRQKVEIELGSSNRKLAELKFQLDQEIQRVHSPTSPPAARMSSYFRSSPRKSTAAVNDANALEEDSAEFEDESPTVVLTETLQALEVEGMQPDYYIERSNTLVELFKRNMTLKYDLAWPVFSLRVQMMLLSESTEVVAAGYRLARYAIADRASLQTIRRLHTDELVILSLVKKGKAILEREQAVKFVRAFLDVKDGAEEVSCAVVRTLVAVAEQQEDRLKNICVLTLTELLMQNPQLLIAANGISTLSDALAEGTFPAPESLVASFLHILDVPGRRRYLKSGREFEAMFAPFTDPMLLSGHEDRLKNCAKAISGMLKTWPGFLTLSMNNASALRSLLDSLQYPIAHSRDLILELLFDILRIKPPSWSTTFLAGRRLSTYGRVAHLAAEPTTKRLGPEHGDRQNLDLVFHFSSLVLATFLKVGLIQALSDLIRSEEDQTIKRKATLLLTEVLKLANLCLPATSSAQIQVLGGLLSPAQSLQTEQQAVSTSMIYQIESINRTVSRPRGNSHVTRAAPNGELPVGLQGTERSKYSAGIDAEQFRQAMIDSLVPAHSQYIKWKWDLIHSIVEGPLTNPNRLGEAIRSPKFLKRISSFYRPFKYRFSMVRNTKPNQRYVRTGVALIRSLAQTSLGIQYLTDNKILRQLAECLAQVDPQSGLTSTSPLFDPTQMAETLSGGYFAMIGALSLTKTGILTMQRWHMMNMFYHIVELKGRDDLIRTLLGNMDFTLDSHLRVMLSRSLTASSKDIRLFSTKILRRYAIQSDAPRESGRDNSHWALRLLLTQLYDPDVEVCEVAIRILEEACNERDRLEYIVKCRPSLDHLGEIGAPMLLRFLSTSVGYHYLNGLDYITQEMDDWFLGRNDFYVTLVEASLARAYIDHASHRGNFGDEMLEDDDIGVVPSHFYRELARTSEGCKLLTQSGHFQDFASTIQDFQLEEEDFDLLTKVKGCLWAVGNVGSMELGSPFLEESDIVGAIIRICEGAEVISLRGTAFYVLGLISRSTHGLEMLLEHGWETAMDPHGRSLGLCMPKDLSRLCSMKYHPVQPDPQVLADRAEKFKEAVTDPSPLKAKILASIVEMGNTVMYKKAAGNLHMIKSKHPDPFNDITFFQKTLTILESHHYRLPSRQFILDLFDKGVMRRIVLEEDCSDSTGSDTG